MLFRHLAVNHFDMKRLRILVASHLVILTVPAAASVIVKMKIAVRRELKQVGRVYTAGQL